MAKTSRFCPSPTRRPERNDRPNPLSGLSRLQNVASLGDNVSTMSCPSCTRLDKDEQLVEAALLERRESLRAALDPELREEIEVEEEELAALLQRIIERR